MGERASSEADDFTALDADERLLAVDAPLAELIAQAEFVRGHLEEAQELVPADAPAATQIHGAPQVWKSPLVGAGLKKGRKGYLATLDNITRALSTAGFWKKWGYDSFHGALMWAEWANHLGDEQWARGDSWHAVDDDFMVQGRIALEQAGFEPVGSELFRDAARRVAHSNAFDSAQLWLGGLAWDGKGRVDEFFSVYYGAAPGPYASAVGRYLWTAMAGRVLCPGEKADMVPILVGEQGTRKSWGIEALVPASEFYITVNLEERDDALARRMKGRLVWEIAELRGLHTREKEAIKSFISERSDTWVPKYQEFAQRVLRRGVFIGTTNGGEFLDDETGNRRWLPVRVDGVDLEALLRDRNQLWAEGATLYTVEGVDWQEAERLGREEHGFYRLADSWEQDVEEWLSRRSSPDQPVSIRDIAVGMGISPTSINRATEMRIAKIMRLFGHTKVRYVQGMSKKTLWKINA